MRGGAAQSLRVSLDQRAPESAHQKPIWHVLEGSFELVLANATHFDRRDKTKLASRLIQRLHELAFPVEVRAA